MPNASDRFYYDDFDLIGYSAGQGLKVRLTSAAFAPYLTVLNGADGSIIYQQGFVGGIPASIHFTLEPGIDYRLRVSSGARLETGSYTLQVFTADPLQKVTRPQTVNGIIATSDQSDPGFPSNNYYVDHYDLVNVPSGRSVTITQSSATVDTFLYVLDGETRAVIAENDDAIGTNARITFTTEADRRYVIRASTAFENATGAYTLLIQ